jgi:dTDP-4-dehydrorhamnose reductase
MKKSFLIIGENSFIGSNLFEFLKNKKLNVYISSSNNFFKNYKKKYFNTDFIINCSSNKEFVKKKYQVRNDNDLIIAKKIINSDTKLIMLSSRKVYNSKFNIKEFDKEKPSCNYSRNKLLSETSVKNILYNRVLILRISNIIGLPNKNKRKLHNSFSDIFFEMVINGYIYNNKKIYKDFISIKKFCEIIFKLLQKNSIGLYNVSVGKKVYLSKIVAWLNFYNPNTVSFINPKKTFNDESFTLNNDKLMNKIIIKNNLNELKNECLKISKKFFLKK